MSKIDITNIASTNKKQLGNVYRIIVIVDKDSNKQLTCKLSRTKQNAIYAKIEFNLNGYYNFIGRAGGGGYHKASAAIEDALGNGGVIGVEYGSGDGPMLSMLQQFATAIGIQNQLFIDLSM